MATNSDLFEIRCFIERKMCNSWREIGHALVIIDDKENAEIGDLLIGTRNKKYTLYDEYRPLPKNIENAAHFRGKGIGTYVVRIILQRLKELGIKQVYGFIANADDKLKVENFWRRNGFEITENRISKTLH